MSAKKTGAMRTGRTAKVRAYLAKQIEARSAREILDAVEPRGDINLMTATLGTMLRNGSVDKTGGGQFGVRWKLGTGKERTAVTVSKPQVRAQALKDAAARHVRGRSDADLPKRKATPAPIANAQTVVRHTGARAREQPTNFSAPLSTVLDPNSAKAWESQQIAADIAAWERRGGRIEQLDQGAASQPLRFIPDDVAAARARGRATQSRNRASRA